MAGWREERKIRRRKVRKKIKKERKIETKDGAREAT